MNVGTHAFTRYQHTCDVCETAKAESASGMPPDTWRIFARPVTTGEDLEECLICDACADELGSLLRKLEPTRPKGPMVTP